MGVGNSLINFFTSSWGGNTGVMSGGNGKVIKSSVSGGQRRGGGFNTSNTGKASEMLENLSGSFGVNYKVKEILESYPLTNLFLGIYESIIGDIIDKTKLEVKIQDAEDNLVEDINKYLQELNLKKFIVSNLKRSLYWGSYAAPIFFDEKTGKFSLGEFLGAEKFIPAFYKGKLKSYVYKEDSVESVSNLEGADVISVPSDEVVYIGFNQHRKFPIVLDKETKKNVEKIIVDLTYLFPSGILDDCLYLLYNHMLNTFISQLLTLKNALRPDVLMARSVDEDQSITETSDDIENVEACLNNNESGVILGLFGGDPSAMLTSITSSILNQLKVVPSLNSYKDFEVISFPELEEKIAKLEADLQNKKLQIGNSLGIPEELLNSSSNRWEVVSRSATFQHAVNKRLIDISNCIKQTVVNYGEKFHKVYFTFDDINITFDTNNILFNTEYLQKQELLNSKLAAISQMSANIEQIKENPMVNRYKFDQWYSGQISTLDPELGEIFAPPPLPEMVDPMTGQKIPPEEVLAMIQSGQIDPNGNPIQPPPEGQEDMM